MLTLRKAIGLSVLFVLLFLSACGAAAATASAQPRTIRITIMRRLLQQKRLLQWKPPHTRQPNHQARQTNPCLAHQLQTSNNEPYDMFFEDYGVNPSIDTEDDNLSTFALDVDTGSYTVMRNYLNDGNLPPADSVRVEEYVNYFEQGYPIPPAHQAFGISMDAAPSPFTRNRTLRYAPCWHSGLSGR